MPMEKQNTVENQLAHTIDQTEYDSRYDRTAKKRMMKRSDDRIKEIQGKRRR